MTKTLPLKKDPATAGARFISASVLTHIIVLHSHSEAAVQCYLVEKKKKSLSSALFLPVQEEEL